ncbi:hypothetical protein BGX31_001258 [Mortierella sp. GBA43]|nr:hypothetical protein BGX31_001258 [Mortierella sp. GBA43]
MTMVKNGQPTASALERVFALPELHGHIAQYLEQGTLTHCSRVSVQWHQDFNPLLWQKVLFRVPQNFSRHGHLVQTLDLFMTNISAKQRDHIRYNCLHLRTVHLRFQQLSPAVLQRLFEPITGNGFVGQNIESLEIYVAEFSVVPFILPCLTRVRQHGYLESLQQLTLGNSQSLGVNQQVDVVDVLEYLRTFPATRTLCFGRIPIGDSRHDSSQGRQWIERIQEGDSVVGDSVHGDNKEDQHPRPCQQQRDTCSLRNLDIYPRTPSVLSCLLQRAPRLLKLCIRKIGDPEVLSIIQQACPDLKNFRYMGNSGYIEDFDWRTFLPSYPWMEELILENALVTDRILRTLSGFCSRHLRYLALTMGVKICTTTLLQALQSCAALECLHCTTPSISGDLFHETNSWVCCKSLRVLRLFEVQLRGPEENTAFRKRIRQLPRLETLSIGGSGFTIEALLDQDDISPSITIVSNSNRTDSILPIEGGSGPPDSPSGPRTCHDPPSSPQFCHKKLKDITIPKFEGEMITQRILKALLEILPRVEYINFNGYDKEAREWLKNNRPQLDMGIIFESNRDLDDDGAG